MTRAPDWPQRLAAFIEARRARAFSWGDNDCALFAADWVREATGVDPAAGLRGTYVTAHGARRVLDEHDFDGLAALVDWLLPALPSPAFAQRGDIVLVRNDGREALAVVDAAGLLGPGAIGVQWLPLDGALRAWKV